jgi:hypothetical protein
LLHEIRSSITPIASANPLCSLQIIIALPNPDDTSKKCKSRERFFSHLHADRKHIRQDGCMAVTATVKFKELPDTTHIGPDVVKNASDPVCRVERFGKTLLTARLLSCPWREIEDLTHNL